MEEKVEEFCLRFPEAGPEGEGWFRMQLKVDVLFILSGGGFESDRIGLSAVSLSSIQALILTFSHTAPPAILAETNPGQLIAIASLFKLRRYRGSDDEWRRLIDGE